MALSYTLDDAHTITHDTWTIVSDTRTMITMKTIQHDSSRNFLSVGNNMEH